MTLLSASAGLSFYYKIINVIICKMIYKDKTHKPVSKIENNTKIVSQILKLGKVKLFRYVLLYANFDFKKPTHEKKC